MKIFLIFQKFYPTQKIYFSGIHPDTIGVKTKNRKIFDKKDKTEFQLFLNFWVDQKIHRWWCDTDVVNFNLPMTLVVGCCCCTTTYLPCPFWIWSDPIWTTRVGEVSCCPLALRKIIPGEVVCWLTTWAPLVVTTWATETPPLVEVTGKGAVAKLEASFGISVGRWI